MKICGAINALHAHTTYYLTLWSAVAWPLQLWRAKVLMHTHTRSSS